MKILITGGAGFIGSAFVKLLAQNGISFAVIDKLTYAGDIKRFEGANNVRFYQSDIIDSSSVEKIFIKEGFDTVVNFAAETHVDRSIIEPEIFVQTNVAGTANLLKLSDKYTINRFIHVSTDEVYGELISQESVKFKESDALLPNSPYSASKASADMLVRAYHKTYGLPTIIVRPSNNYGQWQYPEKLIPLFIAKLLMGERLPVYGKGENIRTWLFVEDCVQAILNIIEKGAIGEIYNIGSSEEMRNIDVVRLLLKFMRKEDDMIEFVADRPGHDFRYAVDTAKIEAATGWKPSISFEEGLEKTIAWCISNKDWLLSKKKAVDKFISTLKESYMRHQSNVR